MVVVSRIFFSREVYGGSKFTFNLKQWVCLKFT